MGPGRSSRRRRRPRRARRRRAGGGGRRSERRIRRRAWREERSGRSAGEGHRHSRTPTGDAGNGRSTVGATSGRTTPRRASCDPGPARPCRFVHMPRARRLSRESGTRPEIYASRAERRDRRVVAPRPRALALAALALRRRAGAAAASAASRGDRSPRAPADAAELAAGAVPRMLNAEPPFRYPAELYAQRVQGNVTLRLHVDSTGRVRPESTTVATRPGTRARLGRRARIDGARLRAGRARRRAVGRSIRFPCTSGIPRRGAALEQSSPFLGSALRATSRFAATRRVRPERAHERRDPLATPRSDDDHRRPRVGHAQPAAVRQRARHHRLDAAHPAEPGRRAASARRSTARRSSSTRAARVKDRIGMPIIEAAEREGRLKPGGTIVEGTSGNTGVGLAIAAALQGLPCIFTMPDKMSQEKVRLLKAFGAEVIITPTAVPPDHPDNYVMMAKRIARGDAERDPRRTSSTTRRTPRRTTRPRARSCGSRRRGGSRTSSPRRARAARSPASGATSRSGTRTIQIIAGDPQGSILAELLAQQGRRDKLEGAPYKVEGIGQDKLPGTLDLSRDRRVPHGERPRRVRDGAPPHARGGAVRRRLGGAHHARRAAASRGGSTTPTRCVVTFLCDTGERYLSKLYNDEWMRENQLLDAGPRDARRTCSMQRKATARRAIVSTAPGALGAAGARPHAAARRVAAPGDGRRRRASAA